MSIEERLAALELENAKHKTKINELVKELASTRAGLKASLPLLQPKENVAAFGINLGETVKPLE